MIYRPVTSNRFQKDLKKAHKRGKDIEKLKAVMHKLVAAEPLPLKHRDHVLIGNYADR
jgi:mRNA interferase YafQ